ncbi:hypothetical protein RDWZM_008037 [Blomia tropicalis]|uniref:Bax inhibitor 1 n=1 Tax=Blomia tropicalis TaxID=40697 RepID=A0A9Q0RJZ7_BLOTA|nr:hypothetical protein RDWZM_008037 [Blomia tropicalis]
MEHINHFVNTFNYRLEPSVKTHLKNVYSTLTASVLSASLGAYLHLFTNLSSIIGPFLQLIATIGFTLALSFSTPDAKNQNKRFGYMLAVGLFSGLSLGPLLEMTLFIDTSILPTALLATAFIFGCFTISAIFADRRQYLYVSGIASSAASLLFFMAITNIFFNSYAIYKTYFYIHFALMCALVLIDTVRIIELRAHGDTDHIMHACMLFLDLIQIFRYLLIILTDKERQSNNNKKKRN